MTILSFLAGVVMGGILYRLLIESKRSKVYEAELQHVRDMHASNQRLNAESTALQNDLTVQLSSCSELHARLSHTIQTYQELTRVTRIFSYVWPSSSDHLFYRSKDKVCRGIAPSGHAVSTSLEALHAQIASGDYDPQWGGSAVLSAGTAPGEVNTDGNKRDDQSNDINLR